MCLSQRQLPILAAGAWLRSVIASGSKAAPFSECDCLILATPVDVRLDTGTRMTGCLIQGSSSKADFFFFFFFHGIEGSPGLDDQFWAWFYWAYHPPDPRDCRSHDRCL